jgi:hypothetical protein
VLAVSGADRAARGGAGRARQGGRKPGLIATLVHSGTFDRAASPMRRDFRLHVLQRALFDTRGGIDRMFTTLLDALFTNVFEGCARL